MKKCLECGSEKILQNAETEERTFILMIKAFGKPDAIVFKDAVTSKVKAKVCVNCGYVQFYATNLSELNRIYEIHVNSYNTKK